MQSNDHLAVQRHLRSPDLLLQIIGQSQSFTVVRGCLSLTHWQTPDIRTVKFDRDILNHLGVDHECDRRTDTDRMAFSNSAFECT